MGAALQPGGVARVPAGAVRARLVGRRPVVSARALLDNGRLDYCLYRYFLTLGGLSRHFPAPDYCLTSERIAGL
jgi:hypothetical protein